MAENIEVFNQNCIRIRGQEGVIYVDPFQMREEPRDADYILITHGHYDHFSPEDIEKAAKAETILVVPEKMEGKAQEIAKLVGRIVAVKPGTCQDVDGLELGTIPAYNSLKPFHPKSAGWVGYIIRVDGQRIYIAGDTDATKEAKAVSCDVALVPVGGTYTMNAKKAAELINKRGQEKLNNLYYQVKEQRRCSAWRKTKNPIPRNSSSRSWICTMPEELRIHNWNVNMA